MGRSKHRLIKKRLLVLDSDLLPLIFKFTCLAFDLQIQITVCLG